MLRDQLIEGVHEVIDLLERSGFIRFIVQSRDVSGPEVFAIMRNVIVAEQRLSIAGRQVVLALEMDDLFDPMFWAELTSDGKGRSDRVLMMRSRVRFVRAGLVSVINLLKRGTNEVEEISPDAEQLEISGKFKLTLIFPEKNSPSAPKRISLAMDGVTEAYNAICFMRGLQDDSLALIACDSGSDKVFDFSGSGEVLKELKELILGAWDRVSFRRQRQLREDLAVISEALPVLAEIEKMKSSESISAEQAELLKRGIVGGIEKIIDAGAIVPEINKGQMIDIRMLASPSPKLLSGPFAPPEIKKNIDFGVDDDNDFDNP